MDTKNIPTCHSDRSGGIPQGHVVSLDKVAGNDTVRNNKTSISFFSSFFGLKSALKRDTSISLGMTVNHHKPVSMLGFTLIELIVVITILVILGTIAFLNLGGFQSSARDSSRVENLSNLKKGLDMFQIKTGSYPVPENTVSVTASGITIGYQGFAKEPTERTIGLSVGGTRDPLDTSIYTTYSVNADRTKMELMNFLEDGSTLLSLNAFVPNASADIGSDYSKRYP
ncbi:MAG: prepilin-type N-terminal cleavage/methylation domain-containing protein, partial [Candidatus Gracilibacteria bacterium]|nr:prepilin-type N-terminal cleavage/methylation domain-containing protein [Candidatus Gracilibacteria bacterium]